MIELGNIGSAYLADGKLEEAETTLLHAEEAMAKQYGPAAFELTGVRAALGELYLKTGDYSKAELELNYALTVRSEGLDYRPDNMSEQDVKQDVKLLMAPLQNLLGALYTVVGFYDRAAPSSRMLFRTAKQSWIRTMRSLRTC